MFPPRIARQSAGYGSAWRCRRLSADRKHVILQLSLSLHPPMPRLRLFRSSSNEWISPLIVLARGLVSVGNYVPFPYAHTTLSAGLAFLELIQMVGKSGDDLRYLAESVVTIMKLLREEMDTHPTVHDNNFQKLCGEFAGHLTQLSKDLETMSKNHSSSKFRKYFNADNVREEIAQFTRRVKDLRANATLIAATGTRMDLIGVASQVAAIDSKVSKLSVELTGQPRTIDSTDGLKQELARFEDDYHALKRGDIHLSFRSTRTAKFTIEIRPNGRKQIAWTDYKATVNGGVRTVRVYQGANPTESWKGFLSFLADNSPSPHFLQLYGFCSSPKLRCLVFHGEYRTLDEYGADLPSPEAIVDWELDLMSDLTKWWYTLAESGSFLNHRILNQFALVDAENGKLTFSHVHELCDVPAYIEFEGEASPFLGWFVQLGWFVRNNVYKIPATLNLPTDTNGDMRPRLDSLVHLQRRMNPGWFHPRALLSPGRVYYYDQNSWGWSYIAGLEGREIYPEPVWRVLHELYVEKGSEGILPEPRPDDCFPTADNEGSGEFTHFIVPLMRSSQRWVSSHDHQARCGYFLAARIQCGDSVPDIASTWMAQAASIVSTPRIGTNMPELSKFYISNRSTLEVRWEMTLRTKADAIASQSIPTVNLPEKIHVFVEVPKITKDYVEEPHIYWSTDPQTVETARLPRSALAIRMRWDTYMHAAHWEPHHYEVAEALQERHGFNPTTNDAAKSLKLPLLEVPLEPLEQDGWGESNWLGFRVLDPHTFQPLENLY
ncbi:hypothetical protein DFH06DRAFT_561831 [Mycena polygramma]|nr:hypothetical protein DFH06DRAFT_561831 [Mycena polygramma]